MSIFLNLKNIFLTEFAKNLLSAALAPIFTGSLLSYFYYHVEIFLNMHSTLTTISFIIITTALSLFISLYIQAKKMLNKKINIKGQNLYGVYWDEHNNPHCPTCFGFMLPYTNKNYYGVPYSYLGCQSCGEEKILFDRHNTPIDVFHVCKEIGFKSPPSHKST